MWRFAAAVDVVTAAAAVAGTDAFDCGCAFHRPEVMWHYCIPAFAAAVAAAAADASECCNLRSHYLKRPPHRVDSVVV